MQRCYIGIANSFHDGAVAIVGPDGEVRYAEATERYLQNKRAINNAPVQYNQIAQLIDAHCDPCCELVLAQSWSDEVQANLADDSQLAKFEALINTTAAESLPQLLFDQYHFSKFCTASASAFIDLSLTNLHYELSQSTEWRFRPPPALRKYDHHLTHAATACFTSPYQEAACAVIDGYGERRSYSCYTYRDGKITALSAEPHPQSSSLGFFYMTVCKLCGFGLFKGEEWKVMGLAAFGQHDPEIYQVLRALIQVEGTDIIQPGFSQTYRLLQQLEAFRRKPGSPAESVADLAHTAQEVFEQTVFEFLSNLHQQTGMASVALGGGCLLNSSANGRIVLQTPFEQAHVYSAPADDGNALGAALLAYFEDQPGAARTPARVSSPYLGSTISTESIEQLKTFGQLPHVSEHPGTVHLEAARLLSEEKIIGWVQGRAEFGPRALGNRSILADPRPADMKDRINARIKFREPFRPFAPSILHAYGPEYFCDYQESPYMERTLRFTEQMRDLVPGVVHEDGTGRLQTVKQEWNPQYYQLIEAFRERTGVPLVLNTSFNVMGKPIIHSLEDALAVFYTTGLDALVIGDLVIEKVAQHEPLSGTAR